MGQSKWRKNNESDYGILKSTHKNERGLVISNPMKQLEGNALYYGSNILDEQELRFSLLYWDKLALPLNNFIQVGNGPEAAYLEQVGVLSRAKPKSGATTLEQHFSVLDQLNEAQPGQWAIALGERSLSIAPGVQQLAGRSSAVLELNRAIPIPNYDVPLAEILEFKLKRRDELLLLREHFEKMSAEISKSQDPKDVLNRMIKEVDSACSNLMIVGREWQFPVKLGSWNASISIEPMKVANYTVGAVLAAQNLLALGLPGSALVAAGAAALSTVAYKPSIFEIRGFKRPMHPYRYAYSIEKEFL